MSIKKIFLAISAIIFLASAFIISFNLGMDKFSEDNNQKNSLASQSETDMDKLTSSGNIEQTVLSNAKITLKVEYIKSGEIVNKIANASEFAGKTKDELEKDNYKVERMTANEVILTKKVDRYAPNKYVLGVIDQCLAIYKTDDEGNMYIEDEKADITDIEVPTEADFNLLVKGSHIFQFNSKEEAEEKLGEYSS